MKFWRLNHPDYESDYKFCFINGTLEHPYGLPGVKCSVCNETWGGSRILAVEYPVGHRDNKHILDKCPISLEQHRVLQREVSSQLSCITGFCPDLKPGDDFQPCYLDVPSRPVADFLWAGMGSVVVSKRIKDLFETMGIGGISLCPVILRKIGKRAARLTPQAPVTGEPEDFINEVPPQIQTASIGPYFELVVQSKSGFAPGCEPFTTSSGCGRKTFANPDPEFIMVESMWNGADIFFWADTHYIVVTDRLKQSLQSLRVTNVEFNLLRSPTDGNQ